MKLLLLNDGFQFEFNTSHPDECYLRVTYIIVGTVFGWV